MVAMNDLYTFILLKKKKTLENKIYQASWCV